MTRAFTIVLKAGSRLREFNFTRVYTDPRSCYCVDVVNDGNGWINFRVRQTENGQWEIFSDDALPEWVTAEKDKLEAALNEEASKVPVPWSTSFH